MTAISFPVTAAQTGIAVSPNAAAPKNAAQGTVGRTFLDVIGKIQQQQNATPGKGTEKKDSAPSASADGKVVPAPATTDAAPPPLILASPVTLPPPVAPAAVFAAEAPLEPQSADDHQTSTTGKPAVWNVGAPAPRSANVAVT